MSTKSVPSTNWNLPGARKASLQELPSVKDRLTFLYLEYCRLSKENNGLVAHFKDGYVQFPVHRLLVLFLGPGTSVSHQAISTASSAGTAIVWVGEGCTKFYACGHPLSNSSTLLMKQAEIAVKPKLHIEAVKRMYEIRFPGENFQNLTLQQLRGKEGARVRKQYKTLAEKYGVPWEGRNYDFSGRSLSDPVNRALSQANSCLYGLAFAVISSLGLSPGIGFIHNGNARSFLFDLTDLYKLETSITVAFQIGSSGTPTLERDVRKEMRRIFSEMHLVERMIKDLTYILDSGSELSSEIKEDFENPLCLWDASRGNVKARIQYHARNEKPTISGSDFQNVNDESKFDKYK